jgi:hypothetical protein
MNEEQKFCKNCEHYRGGLFRPRYWFDYPHCNVIKEPVKGLPEFTCHTNRAWENRCGEGAKWFKQRRNVIARVLVKLAKRYLGL